jgi:hypothetical protein
MEFLEAAGQALSRHRRQSKKRMPSTKRPTQKHHGNGTPHRRASTLRPALRKLGLGSKGPEKEPIPHNPGQPGQPTNNSFGNGGDAAKPLPTKAVPDHKHLQKVLGGGWPVKPETGTNTNAGALRISARDALWFHALRAPRKPGRLNQRERPETSTINNGPAGAPNPSTTTSKNNTTTNNPINSIANLKNNPQPKHPSPTNPNPNPNPDNDNDPPSPTPTITPSEPASDSDSDSEPTPTTRFEPARHTAWRLQSVTGMIKFLPNGTAVVLDRRRADVFRRQVDLLAPPPPPPGLPLPPPSGPPLRPPPGLGVGGHGRGNENGNGHGRGRRRQ